MILLLPRNIVSFSLDAINNDASRIPIEFSTLLGRSDRKSPQEILLVHNNKLIPSKPPEAQVLSTIFTNYRIDRSILKALEGEDCWLSFFYYESLEVRDTFLFGTLYYITTLHASSFNWHRKDEESFRIDQLLQLSQHPQYLERYPVRQQLDGDDEGLINTSSVEDGLYAMLDRQVRNSFVFVFTLRFFEEDFCEGMQRHFYDQQKFELEFESQYLEPLRSFLKKEKSLELVHKENFSKFLKDEITLEKKALFMTLFAITCTLFEPNYVFIDRWIKFHHQILELDLTTLKDFQDRLLTLQFNHLSLDLPQETISEKQTESLSLFFESSETFVEEFEQNQLFQWLQKKIRNLYLELGEEN